MAYDITIALATGHSSVTHYGQIVRNGDGYMWNGSALAASPSYATTALTLTEVNSAGIFGYALPAALPAGFYRFLVRRRAGASPAAGDDIVGNVNFQKSGSSIILE